MFKKLILTISLAALIQPCLAETCPSAADVKNNKLSGWKAFDSDDGTALSAARETQFKKMVEEFALAEWKSAKNQFNSIHCYYRDKTGSSLEAYLAKDHFSPKKNPKSFWYKVSGFMHCAAGKEQCEFENHFFKKQQLATK